ncbi:MAG: 50S ribosomal protein L19 [Rickettsiales bacterium]|jgi:large subunit ribosomal protein L19|nr:50S ribosomal protein L19 [Rickettsiales bacterium]
MNIIKKIEKAQVEKLAADKKIPVFKAGDTVKVHVKIKDGDKFRVQVFEGVVIARDGGDGARASFTVRRESYGVGVERKFPLYSPSIDKIEKIQIGKVRRAKLFFLRRLSGKKARIIEDLAATSAEKLKNKAA